MMGEDRLSQGTADWLEMAGLLMCDAASRADLPSDLTVSLVERYTDGVVLSDGLIQGIRFELAEGRPSFRIGVRPNERADVVVEITAAAARRLNMLRSDDPAYAAARDRYLETGEMRVEGDPSRLGDWLEAVHDPIVARTR
jgi:hypothetical protein